MLFIFSLLETKYLLILLNLLFEKKTTFPRKILISGNFFTFLITSSIIILFSKTSSEFNICIIFPEDFLIPKFIAS